MATLCECPHAGFCKRHGVDKSPEMHTLCASSTVVFRLWETGKGPGQIIKHEQPPEIPNKLGAPKASPEIRKRGPGSILKERFKAFGVPPCQACNQLSQRMDAWGPDGCEQHFDEIVNEIHNRAVQWFKSSKSWVDKLRGAAPGFAQRMVIEGYVKDAIREARED